MNGVGDVWDGEGGYRERPSCHGHRRKYAHGLLLLGLATTMKIADQVRKTVAFLGFEDKRNGDIRLVGSAFFVGPDPSPGATATLRVFVVTARHVIEGLRGKGIEECVLRLNPLDPEQGVTSLRIRLDQWQFHPNDESVDVAVYEHGVPQGADHLVLGFSLGATPENLASNEVALGDEVFISGLFKHHYGARRNIPIVRTGNLAALDEEPIATKRGQIHGYLIEARSIGGLSGSPVFINLGHTRFVGGAVQLRSGGPEVMLLGLIHGHYQLSGAEEALMGEDTDEATIQASINAGIAVVVPFVRIAEVIQHAMRPSFHATTRLLQGGWPSANTAWGRGARSPAE